MIVAVSGLKGDHDVVWLQVSVHISKLVEALYTSYYLFEDSWKMLWVPVQLEILPKVHLILL